MYIVNEMLRDHHVHVQLAFSVSFFTTKQSSLQVNNLCCHYYFGMPIKFYLIIDLQDLLQIHHPPPPFQFYLVHGMCTMYISKSRLSFIQTHLIVIHLYAWQPGLLVYNLPKLTWFWKP